jgi:hypothetical protein
MINLIEELYIWLENTVLERNMGLLESCPKEVSTLMKAKRKSMIYIVSHARIKVLT